MTVWYGDRRLDVSLPATLPWAELQAAVVRLLVEAVPGTDAAPWTLQPIGRSALALSDTLCSAGVVDGEPLVLGQGGQGSGQQERIFVRDALEDSAASRSQLWSAWTSLRLALWATILMQALLLIPALRLARGTEGAGLAAALAVMTLMVAVVASGRCETACSAVGVAVSCAWAGAAGWVLAGGPSVLGPRLEDLRQGSISDRGDVVAQALVSVTTAAVAAAMLAVCAALLISSAVVHAAALIVVAAAVGGTSLFVGGGANLMQIASCIAVLALLTTGVAPRAALAVSGLGSTDISGGTAETGSRIVRAHLILTGILIGLSAVVVLAVISSAMSGLWWQRALTAGIGLSLMLRSRMFSQIPHLLAPRVAALIILVVLVAAVHGSDVRADSVLILGASITAGMVVAFLGWVAPAISPVGWARAGRIMDLADRAVVIGVLILTAGLFGLFDWMAAVIG